MTSTHGIILGIAERIRLTHPAEADKLLFVASDVRWLERIVAAEVAACKEKR